MQDLCGLSLKRALGFFDKWHDVHPPRPSLWDPNASWVWHSFDEQSCPVNDFLSQALLSNETKMKILLIGDSMDRNIVFYFCDLPIAKTRGFKLTQWSMMRFGCSNGIFQIVAYMIFGLHMPSQHHIAVKIETRNPRNSTWQTSWRLSKMLQIDVPDVHSFTAIMVQSCLWDLSRPVTSTDPLRANVALEYLSEVRRLSYSLQQLYPAPKRYWRTCPFTNYPDIVEVSKSPTITRTKRNQIILNDALHYAVATLDPGYRMVWLTGTI